MSTTNADAWLAVIRYAEGTSKYSDPYSVAFTGASFDSSKPHPGIVRGSAGGYQSDAHGAYQFLSKTWKWINTNHNPPMTRENQDKAALKLIKGRGVDPNAEISRGRIARLAPEWASLPTWDGRSYYGQPCKDYGELVHVWAKTLRPEWEQV